MERRVVRGSLLFVAPRFRQFRRSIAIPEYLFGKSPPFQLILLNYLGRIFSEKSINLEAPSLKSAFRPIRKVAPIDGTQGLVPASKVRHNDVGGRISSPPDHVFQQFE